MISKQMLGDIDTISHKIDKLENLREGPYPGVDAYRLINKKR